MGAKPRPTPDPVTAACLPAPPRALPPAPGGLQGLGRGRQAQSPGRSRCEGNKRRQGEPRAPRRAAAQGGPRRLLLPPVSGRGEGKRGRRRGELLASPPAPRKRGQSREGKGRHPPPPDPFPRGRSACLAKGPRRRLRSGRGAAGRGRSLPGAGGTRERQSPRRRRLRLAWPRPLYRGRREPPPAPPALCSQRGPALGPGQRLWPAAASPLLRPSPAAAPEAALSLLLLRALPAGRPQASASPSVTCSREALGSCE